MIKLLKIVYFLVLFNVAFSVYSNIYIVNTSNLPDNETFKQNMTTLFNINQYVNHWSVEWNYPIEKSGVITFLKAFHNDVLKINRNNNYELNLLNVVIMTYLYNLDETSYSKEIYNITEKMKKDFPNEYRTYWLLGNFYISSANPLNGYNEFKKIFIIFNNNMSFYPLEYLDDYAYACIINQMFKTGMEIYEYTAERRKIPVSSNRLYGTVEKSFSKPLYDNNYSETQVWEIIKNNNEYYLRSRMLGTLLPLVPTWGLNIFGLNNKKSFCMITPDRLLSKQKNYIGISILIEYDLNNTSYDRFIAEKRSSFPVTEKKEFIIGSQKYDVFIFEDNSRYQNMGGAKGLYITTSVKYSENKKIGIELPLEFNFNNSQDGNSLSYYTISNCFY